MGAMDHLLESLLEGFFESFTLKLRDYVSNIESKVIGFGTGIGRSVANGVLTNLWDDLRGRFILLVLGLHAVYVVRVFVYDLIALYGLATRYWRVTMFVSVTLLVLMMVTMKGEAVEVHGEGSTETVEVGMGSSAVEKTGDRRRATSYSYWWTSSIRKSDGKVQTTTEETTLNVNADGMRMEVTELDMHKSSKSTPVKKFQGKMKEKNELSTIKATLRPSKLVAAGEHSTVQISADGRSTFTGERDCRLTIEN
jgi:hypothetical protein